MVDCLRVLDNVDRHEHLDKDEFIDRYLRSQKPVIIRNGQSDTAISLLNTEDKILEAFGNIPIQVQKNYTSPLTRAGADVRRYGLSQKVRNEIYEMPLLEYCRHIRENPDTDLLCVEYGAPEGVLAAMRTPEYCDVSWSKESLISFMFIANRGNYAHLHFDGDFRHVLLYQVFGRKRVVMVPLESFEKISSAMNFSKLLIQNMAEAEKLDLFRYLGAYDCVIEPGETIYFPASIWHYIEYIDTGMSVNFRFGRDSYSAGVVDANRVPFYPELHLMLSRLNSLGVNERRHEIEQRIWRRIREVLGREYSCSRERHLATQAMYQELAHSLIAPNRRPAQLGADCLIAEAMAIERHDAASKRWREELRLGSPL